MRIGIVCPYSLAAPGGVQTHVLGFASWLRSQGHEAYVLAPEANRLERSVMSAGRARAFAYNGSVARVAVGAQAMFSVLEWLRLGCFDIVHIHEPLVPLLGLATMLKSQQPVVATFHAQRSDPSWLRVPVSRHIAAGIAVSAAAAVGAKRRTGITSYVIGNGIATPSVIHRADKQLSPIVAFVGRFDEPRKGFRTLLAAWPRVLQVMPNARLLVAGPGTPIPASNVEYLGVVDTHSRDELLTQAAVLVAPNTGQESFGMVTLEALACGTPVVASDLPEFRAVLSDKQGVVARTVPVGDYAALAAAVVQTLRQPLDSKRGIAVAQRYSWDTIGSKVLAVYHGVIS
ncbi:MAG: glycosyltransferase family 4 protein [Propionibacteriaceae bacterium]|nr:glycosyltransferase family 4 protein [Propionibacteriaceae bacterium]